MLPKVECGACGRVLSATTQEPYGLLRPDGRYHYFYVRTHNRPDGQPCGSHSTEPMPVVGRRWGGNDK